MKYLTELSAANNSNAIEGLLHQTFLEVHALIRKNSQHLKNSSDCNFTDIEEMTTNEVRIQTFVTEIQKQYRSILIAVLVGSIVYGFSCVLMMIGSMSRKKQFLMIPYLCIQLVLFVMFLTNRIFVNLTLSALRLY